VNEKGERERVRKRENEKGIEVVTSRAIIINPVPIFCCQE